ncbi:hypothetical protein SBY92_002709 [Candida maltosa Xu316]|uniref:MARVEL domain-containing protein n=1 Tax=Candida maltosa (strain Xu316) TaxID=1245528 RepID=M3HGX4_CANMX|nr:hypothetical protein G210_3225 [Candida maltosa Xu316]
MHWKQITTYAIRGTQFAFAVIDLGLAAGILAKWGTNFDRATYALVVGILNLLYIGYAEGLVPFVFKNQAPSFLILVCESIFTIFYLAAMGAVADVTNGCDAWGGFGYHSFWNDVCKLFQALTAFTLLNWLLFIASLVLFIIYSFIPEVKAYGFKHSFQNSTFEFGVIFAKQIVSEVTPADANAATENQNEEDASAGDKEEHEEPSAEDDVVVPANNGIPETNLEEDKTA